jgi:catechol 2,3-dioxygenase-like lactoylglutathione lyase family enzyme
MATISRVTSLDHLVITVKHLDRTVKFYQEVLGMKHTSFTSSTSPEVQRHALIFGQSKINIHVSGSEFEPKAEVWPPVSAFVIALTEI